LMVRANEAMHVPFRLRTDQRAAVATDVVESPDLSIIPAHDDDRVAVHIVCKVITWIGDLTAMPGKEPAPSPECLKISLVNQFIVVERSW
jgi:hypothetical protein